MTVTPEQAAADIVAKLADAAKALADAEYSRAQADKQRADAEQVRADIEADRRLAQNALDVAALDLEAKQIANRAAHDQAVGARTDKLIEQLTGAVPDLASIEKSTVSFRDGKALRQGEAISVALSRVSVAIAEVVVDTFEESAADSVFVTDDPDLVSAIAAYRQLLFEAKLLEGKVDETLDEARETLQAEAPQADLQVRMGFAVGEAGIVAAAVAGKAITQLASLFQIDVDVASSSADIGAGSVQVAVMQQIATIRPATKVKHAWTQVTRPSSSALLTAIESLTTLNVQAAPVGAQLDAAVKALGDPEAELARAQKVIKDDKSTAAERAQAEDDARDARRALVRLAAVQGASTDLVAILTKARAFAERITAPAPAGGPSALAKAISIESLAGGNSKALVLCLQGGKAETHQIVVKRRLWWPRIQTSTSVEVDYMMVAAEDGRAWGGHATAAHTHAGVINGDGAEWNVVNPYPVPVAPPESAPRLGQRLAVLDAAHASGDILKEERDAHRDRILGRT